jgi:protein tyrosine phosphatase (PTP) superfamily phosphohydrolase (DUF442 family)
MFKRRYLLAVAVALGLSTSAYARHHHHHHHHDEDDDDSKSTRVYEYRYEVTPPLEGEPIGNDEAARIEVEDARVGDEADRAAEEQRDNLTNNGNIVRYPDIEIKNLSRDGNIWIGGEPTLEGYRQVHKRGVVAIVDVRNPTSKQKESAREAKKLGMDYINLPISPKNLSARDAEAFLGFMRKYEGKQVLIHCGSANRASGMYAVYLGVVKGMSTDEAVERAKQTGLREAELEHDVRDYLDNHRPQPANER